MGCGGNNSGNGSSSEQTQPEEDSGIDSSREIGIGPVKHVTLGEIDEELAANGKEVFKTNCSACHKFKKRYVGPPLLGITERKTPEWIMNMILNPDVMLAEDEAAKELLAEYIAPMANQNINEEDARAILEYFRLKDKSD